MTRQVVSGIVSVLFVLFHCPPGIAGEKAADSKNPVGITIGAGAEYTSGTHYNRIYGRLLSAEHELYYAAGLSVTGDTWFVTADARADAQKLSLSALPRVSGATYHTLFRLGHIRIGIGAEVSVLRHSYEPESAAYVRLQADNLRSFFGSGIDVGTGPYNGNNFRVQLLYGIAAAPTLLSVLSFHDGERLGWESYNGPDHHPVAGGGITFRRSLSGRFALNGSARWFFIPKTGTAPLARSHGIFRAGVDYRVIGPLSLNIHGSYATDPRSLEHFGNSAGASLTLRLK